MQLFPTQGNWSEEEYIALETNHLVEFSHGTLKILEMPSEKHHDVVFMLAQLLRTFVTTKRLGKVLMAPFPIQLWPGKFREPDIAFMLTDNAARRHARYWVSADMVIEVLSGDRNRDLVTKRREYAQARIPEYWIVDPEAQTILVLSLDGDSHRVHGEFGKRDVSGSPLLKEFKVDLSELFGEELNHA